MEIKDLQYSEDALRDEKLKRIDFNKVVESPQQKYQEFCDYLAKSKETLKRPAPNQDMRKLFERCTIFGTKTNI